jgi:Na+/H+ antiporter NhaC
MHLLGCGAGVLLLALGAAFEAPVVAIGGAIICGAFCLDMVRMMVGRPRRT